MPYKKGSAVLGCLAICLVPAVPALSHPLGNFSIDRYSRVRITAQALRVRYVVDMAEIPAFQELQDADTDGDGQISADERQRYVERRVRSLTAQLIATFNGTALAWQIQSRNLTAPSSLIAPATGTPAAPFRIVLDLVAEFGTSLATENSIRYVDENYSGRTGWKEIVLEEGDGIRLLRSTASRQDLSRELTQYPPDVSAPPQDVAAEFTFAAGTGLGWVHAFLKGVREEDYLWLMVVVAAVGLFARWRTSRTAGGRP